MKKQKIYKLFIEIFIVLVYNIKWGLLCLYDKCPATSSADYL